MPTPYEELLALPEYLIGEIVGGRLLTRRLPPPRHAYAYSSLVRCLGGAMTVAVSEADLESWLAEVRTSIMEKLPNGNVMI